MKLNCRNFIKSCFSAAGAIAAGNVMAVVEPWLVEEIAIVDVQLDDGWMNVAKLEHKQFPPAIRITLDAERLIQCICLIDKGGNVWRVVGDWDGIKRESDGLTFMLTEEAA